VPASASIFIANDPVRPALRVDGRGNAEVSWTAGGARSTVIVPAHGQLTHGGSLAGPDASRPAAVAGLPFAQVVRRTSDGRHWALQVWRPQPAGPIELHLARWRGAPRKLTLNLSGALLKGRAIFAGYGVSGFSTALEGKRLRIYVYLDYLAGVSWHRMLGVAPHADGSFQERLRPHWKGARYRATMLGPNAGASFAPDARVVISTS
jgi:hypothetical protein